LEQYVDQLKRTNGDNGSLNLEDAWGTKEPNTQLQNNIQKTEELDRLKREHLLLDAVNKRARKELQSELLKKTLSHNQDSQDIKISDSLNLSKIDTFVQSKESIIVEKLTKF